MFERIKNWFAKRKNLGEQKSKLPEDAQTITWKLQKKKALEEAKKEEKVKLPTIPHLEQEHEQFTKEGMAMKSLIMKKGKIKPVSKNVSKKNVSKKKVAKKKFSKKRVKKKVKKDVVKKKKTSKKKKSATKPKK